MTEPQAEYVTAQELDDANEMIGAGYYAPECIKCGRPAFEYKGKKYKLCAKCGLQTIIECVGCREIREFPDDYDKSCPVCKACKDWETERANANSGLETCSRCGYVGIAFDSHHVHGRKVSSKTIRVCSNCHREIHAGASI